MWILRLSLQIDNVCCCCWCKWSLLHPNTFTSGSQNPSLSGPAQCWTFCDCYNAQSPNSWRKSIILFLVSFHFPDAHVHRTNYKHLIWRQNLTNRTNCSNPKWPKIGNVLCQKQIEKCLYFYTAWLIPPVQSKCTKLKYVHVSLQILTTVTVYHPSRSLRSRDKNVSWFSSFPAEASCCCNRPVQSGHCHSVHSVFEF